MAKSKSMKLSRLDRACRHSGLVRYFLPVAVLGFFASFGAIAPPAQAGCTDPPQPRVNWQRCNMDGLDLSGTDLSDARLRDTSFIRATLEGVQFRKVSAFHAKFINAQLRGTNFDGARLEEADFTKADLEGASFAGADLRRAKLFRSSLKSAKLSGARLDDADLTRADLSGATWTDGKRICAENSIGRCN